MGHAQSIMVGSFLMWELGIPWSVLLGGLF